MKFMFGLQHPLTCKPSTTLSNPCNKVRGEYFSKEVFLCLPSCVFIVVSLWRCRWLYNIVRFGACASRVLQGFITNLVTVNDSFKHHNTTSTRGTKKNAGIEGSKQKKQEQTGNYKRNRPTRKEQKKKEQTSNKKKKRKEKGTDRREKNRKKKRKEKREKEKKIVSRALIHVTSISLCYLNWV